ncbi:PREDICTED: uncharacterized protein LOC105558330 [Vollenhovia emeryi]|uniref:uncharacterized protein LOC105558330 n=1 Tax=Vollenhovia emeryi TaxID=411798 RepID=UPI0005F541EC|nr:PREDICTED: uncharacterized protein LOC105558330 [Vollenhovia emeryi]
MDFAGEQYYKLNRILLLSVGLWPYQISTFKKTQIIFIQTLFISILICQCSPFLVKQHSIKSITKMVLFIALILISMTKYYAGLLLSDNIKYIFDRIRYDWNMLKAQAELEVIRRYADNAKFHTIFFLFLSVCFLLAMSTIICLPRILDVIIPMNESRPPEFIIMVEYFVDEETYFSAIVTHIILTYYTGLIIIVAMATIAIAYALHTSALFKIASYRIENIFNENVHLPKDIKQYMLHNNLIRAVYVHRRAIDLTNILTKSFATLYFILLGLSLVSMSLSFFNCINAVTSQEKVEFILTYSGIIFLHLYYVFLGNYVGQDIIDSSIGFSQATYNAQWHTAPLCMQKLIPFIIQRSNKKSALTAGGLFDASLEGFATLLSMSMSYVMVLQSVGQHKGSHETDNSYVYFEGQRYYWANRFILEMMGLWPYNNSMYIYIYRTLMIFLLVSSGITQVAKLRTTIYDLDRFLYNLTYCIPCLIYILKFIGYIMIIDRVKEIMSRIEHDWNTLKDEKECEIIRYYTIIGMRYTIVFLTLCIPFLFIFIFGFYVPGILDLINPLNESRARKLPLLADYFILDEQKFYYPILVHQSLLVILGITIVLATDTLNMVYVHHACGLFEVASYRMKHVFDDGMFSVTTNEKYAIIHARIVKVIHIHRKTVEFLDYILSTFGLTYFLMLMLGVITITINMFRLIEAVLAMNDFGELLACVSFIGGQYGILFFANYFGQKLTDRSCLIFDEVYDSQWYAAPVHIQKLFMFILQRTVKGYVLNIGSVIMASLEGFASMASLTLSYLTMIYSVR